MNITAIDKHNKKALNDYYYFFFICEGKGLELCYFREKGLESLACLCTYPFLVICLVLRNGLVQFQLRLM